MFDLFSIPLGYYCKAICLQDSWLSNTVDTALLKLNGHALISQGGGGEGYIF